MLLNHCHVMPEGVFNKNRPEEGTLQHLNKIMEELGIEEAVLFAPFTYQIPEGSYRCNQWLWELIRKKRQFYGFVTVHPLDPDALNILNEFANKGFVGVKFHPAIFRVRLDDSAIEPFYAEAERLNLPILFHVGIHGWQVNCYAPILLDKIAQNHPRLKIIVEHMGGYEFFHQALAVVRNNPNCYAGISTVLQEDYSWYIPQSELMYLLRTVGPERIIYGADFPYNGLLRIKRDIEIIRSWNLSQEDEENILGKNLKRLLPLKSHSKKNGK
ncbi:amidohydrolase family protein [Candidatus Aerophobetes bacterium]|nr:amidohydrolase family protein [Candidatus Aerophobetes bacterium]